MMGRSQQVFPNFGRIQIRPGISSGGFEMRSKEAERPRIGMSAARDCARYDPRVLLGGRTPGAVWRKTQMERSRKGVRNKGGCHGHEHGVLGYGLGTRAGLRCSWETRVPLRSKRTEPPWCGMHHVRWRVGTGGADPARDAGPGFARPLVERGRLSGSLLPDAVGVVLKTTRYSCCKGLPQRCT